MAANKKKKRKLRLPNKKLLVAGGAVVAVALIVGLVHLQHARAVTADRNRFARAGNDVKTVANAVVAAVGQPADRKDGGKCSYAHQEFTQGPLSCEVYSYLAYGVSSPDQVNAIVQKVDALPVLHGTPWQFKAVTEKPHQFVNGVTYSDTFVPLKNLFDTEIRTSVYASTVNSMSCSVSFLYHNSLSDIGGYPALKIPASQAVIVDTNCAATSKAPIFSIEE